MLPVYGNAHNFIAMFSGNENILCIKAPVIERLERENFAGALHGCNI